MFFEIIDPVLAVPGCIEIPVHGVVRVLPFVLEETMSDGNDSEGWWPGAGGRGARLWAEAMAGNGGKLETAALSTRSKT